MTTRPPADWPLDTRPTKHLHAARSAIKLNHVHTTNLVDKRTFAGQWSQMLLRFIVPVCIVLTSTASCAGDPHDTLASTGAATSPSVGPDSDSSSGENTTEENSETGTTTSTSEATTETSGPDTTTEADATTVDDPVSCPCYAGDGPYCGDGLAEYTDENECIIDLLEGHESDILYCSGGEWSLGETCTDGCETTTPGEGDTCLLPVCPCFVQVAWCGSGAAEHGQTLDPPCRVPLVPEHNDDILACDGEKWIVKQPCELGCHENEMGVPDTCNDESSFKLPYTCGDSYTCSQGNNGSSHQGSQKYAYDFAMPRGTKLRATRGGVIAYAEMRSPQGSTCYDPPGLLEQCHNKANFVGIRHNDGTVSLYMHLQSISVKVGDPVSQGDVIGRSGNSGYTTGPHLHIQLQNDCGIWFCQSVPLSFADAPNLKKGGKPTSGNCP